MSFRWLVFASWVLVLGIGGHAVASDGDTTPGSSGASIGATYVFTIAPREPVAEAKEKYAPIAELLSRATGAHFEFWYTDDWWQYQRKMRDDVFDMAFDGPHFVGWRISALHHDALLKLERPRVWTIVVRKDNQKILKVDNLVGKPVCAHALPSFGALVLDSLYSNPSRQPSVLEIHGWKAAYDGIVEGRCVAAVMPKDKVVSLDSDNKLLKIIFQDAPTPNQAISVSRRMPGEIRSRVVSAILSEEGVKVTEPLRARDANSSNFVKTDAREYKEAREMLRNSMGFWFN
jgi:ABC-type phosphate/phosphonate transport system substrate-binding protein